MKIPCKDCLILSVCKQKKKIDCNELYDYVDKRNSFPKELPTVHKLRRSNSLYVLNKGTTRWYPDS